MQPPKCTVFFNKKSCQPQYFSLPKPIIDYLATSSPRIYEKYMKLCKYFFASNPILILCLHFNDKEIPGWTCSPFGKCFLKHLKVDLEKIKTKIWLNHSLDVYGYIESQPQILSTLTPRIYRSDIIQLELSNQSITFEDFLFLTPLVRQIFFLETTIKYKNGNFMQFEEIIVNLPNLTTLIYYFLTDGTDISAETVHKFTQNVNPDKLGEIDLNGIPEIFDFSAYSDFMNKNQHILYRLRFLNTVPGNYKAEIQSYLENLKPKTKTFNPQIHFHK